ncbi:SRPBCC domain-containing protein [Herbiconiux moechotypicola]|uniref:SRPBCC domain-containing protein n=1 Tax=Herbiconiux moechotypicola TaxID=637393 RepID=A0ABN3DEG0_9MICO|nr:SRPBCC domain-containing protein [Herbiconiux moechotypicola]MCS5729265.1 SRPBCC domain-containing protein [Herbiconiux moechotypicola]
MPVTQSTVDDDQHSLTIEGEFAAPVDRVWQLWADPRQLERWWGPPTWPATFRELELHPGGTAHYVMTGPDGTEAGGMWNVTAVDAPTSFSFDDRFADADGHPLPDMPVTHGTVTLEPIGGDVVATRMLVVSHYDTADELHRVLEMGMEEGMRLAAGQIDALLAE